MSNLLIRRKALEGVSGVNHDGYVSDGLILRLDGIRNTRNGHDATYQGWQDLSGNNNDCTFANGSGLVWMENGLNFLGTGGYVRTPLKYADYCLNHTVEIVADYNSNNKSLGKLYVEDFSSNEWVYSGINLNNNQVACMLYGANNHIGWFGITFPSTYTRCVTTINENSRYVFYIDCGERGTQNTTELSTLTPKGYTSIGWRFYTLDSEYSYLNAKVLSVRLYNRVLTQAEISSNYSVDQSRFFT